MANPLFVANRGAYYNEIEPELCAFLRLAMAEGLIPQGEVDERSIEDVHADDLIGFRQVHLFAGCAGWPVALRRAGWSDDRGVWTLSAPCQPFSVAGLGGGESDRRHLYPHASRLIAKREPAKVFGEQVASPAGRAWLAAVRADLEGMGYAVGGSDLCAASIGAQHIRQRIYWFADAEWNEQSRQESRSGAPGRVGRVEQSVPRDTPWPSALAKLRVLDDGLPRSVAATDAARNAIVTGLAAEFVAACMEVAA